MVINMSDRFVSNNLTELSVVDSLDTNSKPTTFFKESWNRLRKNPIFIISSILILLIIFVALFPFVFTNQDPLYANLEYAKKGTGNYGGFFHLLGTDMQGYDIFTRIIYGTRASVIVGVMSTLLTVVLGGFLGSLAGYFGGWIDALISRIIDIFYAIPFLLGAIIILSVFNQFRNVWVVIVVLGVFGWTTTARITRGAVMSAKQQEYITASKALGVSRPKQLFKHIIPNSISPVIVNATVSLGSFIVSEATLSFLGLGLPTSSVSWGADISAAQALIRTHAYVLFWPSLALAVCVLSFILLGDAVREALDPKLRK